MNVYAGIMAGGIGTRLWPLSQKNRPKQLIPFLNNTSLLDQAIARVEPVVSSQKNIFVVTNQSQESLIQQAVGKKTGFIISEPEGRNTAPALLLGCYYVFKRDPQAVIIFLPADHFMPNTHAFVSVIQKALNYAQHHDTIALLGLKPGYAATGYGYIQKDINNDNADYNKVITFHEKPSTQKAQEYLNRNDMLWNMGIFVARASTWLREFKTCAPELDNAMQKYLAGKGEYAACERISIDYAVMEKSNNTVVFTTDFEWYDVGNIYTFLYLKQQYSHDNIPIININAHNNLALATKKMIVCIGIDNISVVETDDAILVVKNESAELVKHVPEKINELAL